MHKIIIQPNSANTYCFGKLRYLDGLYSFHNNICRHTLRMTAIFCAADIFIVFLTSITAIDGNRLSKVISNYLEIPDKFNIYRRF